MEPFNPCTHQTTVARLEWDTLTPAPAHCLVLPENGEHSARSELRKCANTLSQGTQHCLASPFPRNLFNPICAESCVQWLKHTIDVSICGMVIRTNIIHMGTPYGLMLIHVYPHPLMFFFLIKHGTCHQVAQPHSQMKTSPAHPGGRSEVSNPWIGPGDPI